MKRFFPLVLLVIICIPALAQIKSVSIKKAQKIIAKHKNDPSFVIIDFRNEEMYNAGHLKNAILIDIFLPEAEKQMQEMSRNKAYLIYCSKGHRSARGLVEMKKMGFLKIFHLKVGIDCWYKKGLLIEKNSTIP